MACPTSGEGSTQEQRRSEGKTITTVTSYGKAPSERPTTARAALVVVLTLALAVAMAALSIVLGSGVGAAHAAETSSTTAHAWAWGVNWSGQLGVATLTTAEPSSRSRA
jgi:hypothetical protein